MAFTLEDIVPFGRSWRDYVAMFDLGDTDLAGFLLGCGDGPASFNAELSERGGRAVSLDPVYAFSADRLRQRIEAALPEVMAGVRANRDNFLWDRYGDPGGLEAERRAAMDRFLADLPAGRREGRYVAGSLPRLPFAPRTFDLALVSHLLFLYSGHLDGAFHVGALKELARAAREVRVFPLLDLDARPSPHLDPVRKDLAAAGLDSELVRVPYAFQKGGDRMLRVADV